MAQELSVFMDGRDHGPAMTNYYRESESARTDFARITASARTRRDLCRHLARFRRDRPKRAGLRSRFASGRILPGEQNPRSNVVLQNVVLQRRSAWPVPKVRARH